MNEVPLESFAAKEPNSFVDGPFGSDLKVSDYAESGVRILQLQNVGDGSFIDDNVKFTTERKALQLSRCLVRPGDLLIAKMADPLARACIVPPEIERGLIVADLMKLRLGQQHDATYVCSAINSPAFRREAERLSTGTTRTRISLSTLKQIRLPERAPKEEERIGSIARTMDEVIEQTEALIAKQQQVKAGLMHDLFTRGLTPGGQLRPTRAEAPDLYHETPLGWIPKDWSPDTIGGVSDSLIDGPFGSNLKTEHYVIEPGVRVVRLQNVGATEYDDSERAFISDAHAGFLLKNQVLPGDVLIAGLGEETHVVGRACCYPPDLPPAINKADCFRLRCRAGKMLNSFAMFFLNTAGAQRQIRRYEQGVTRLRINTGNLKKIATGVPGIPEQAAIVERLQAGIDQVETTHGQLAKLRQLKQGLMQALLTPPGTRV